MTYCYVNATRDGNHNFIHHKHENRKKNTTMSPTKQKHLSIVRGISEDDTGSAQPATLPSRDAGHHPKKKAEKKQLSSSDEEKDHLDYVPQPVPSPAKPSEWKQKVKKPAKQTNNKEHETSSSTASHKTKPAQSSSKSERLLRSKMLSCQHRPFQIT